MGNKHVVVAGAAGFIGKALCRALKEKGYRITAVTGRNNTGCEYCNRVLSFKELGKEGVAKALLEEEGGYDCFYDLAWAGTSGAARADYNVQTDNIRMTCDYVGIAAEAGCRTFLYASSINEMETYEYLQSDGCDPGGGYIYGAGKLAAHLMAETFARMRGISFIPVIITNIYGVGEHSARLINTSVRKLISGEHCAFTEGNQTYDFIYIDDAISAIIAAAEKGRPFHRYYIGSGKPKALRVFLSEMRDIVSPEAELGFGEIPFRGKDISYDQFDLDKVEHDTGYRNRISFKEGIRMLADSVRGEETNG